MKIRGNLKDLLPRFEAAVDRAIAESAEAIEERAKANAPVETGDYRDSIDSAKLAPLRYQTYSDSDHAFFDEYGTEDTPAFATLRNAADTEKEATIKRVQKAVKNA